MRKREPDNTKPSSPKQRWTNRIREYAPYIFILCTGAAWLLLIFTSPNI